MAFEPVHTVWDYHDGPVTGLAGYRDQPHYFERIFDEAADEYSERFSLSPIDGDTFRIALEQWAIWFAWEAAFHSGKAAQETHPGYGGRDARYDELKAQLNDRLARVHALPGLFEGDFRIAANAPELPKGVRRPMEVEWRSS